MVTMVSHEKSHFLLYHLPTEGQNARRFLIRSSKHISGNGAQILSRSPLYSAVIWNSFPVILQILVSMGMINFRF